MAINVDVRVAETQTWPKQSSVAPLKPLAEHVVPLNTLPCGAQCPTCSQEGAIGTCMLNEGHTGQHQCDRDSTHQWSPDTIPGPHGS